ncbi:LPS-assembly protein LptD [Pseudorhodobacter sp. E13]|uniref:LPS-assembly protein LptD n=1 Tax=Pseudorhodobacter sp. E13 TaxID=2487931 RepID=UPI000F8DE1EC|nr:LPS assembly protein LptD [Pseudorhodobacter sp. E13]RUS60337.1 LPS-assembly protein LptD [Pseudorhodobacter sp. E13]
MMRLFTILLTLCTLLAAPLARAQDLASLVADRVAIAGNDTLLATGNVEVFHKGKRLKASRITYDRGADRLTISGPIVLTDDSGTIILASQAELSSDFSEGVLQSARLVLDQQLQMAASEMMRIGGRYTSLNNSVVSSCKVCANNPTPLWEIRANRVIHDELERQIYFENASFRLAGVPIFWVPRLRMPDPTLKRQTGFLAPSFRTTSELGFGVKVPYFIRIGDDKDLTVTPYISSKDAQTLGLRYRQAFATGTIELNGALSRDQILPGEARGYLTTEGRFTLPKDFTLDFSGIIVTDEAYLLDYGISSADRLDSRVEAFRTRRNEHISARLINYRSIRAGDSNSTLPTIVGDLTYQRRFSPNSIGGEGGFRVQSHSHYRSSDIDTDSDGDGISDGRDLARLSFTADWRRNWVLPAGILGAAFTEMNGDFYSITQDSTYAGDSFRGQIGTGVELRWPWVRASQNGVSHIIEPVVQLVTTKRNGAVIPNEDSVLVEFDESNLFSLSRFAGADAIEKGPRANIGLSYTRLDPTGWTMGLTFGRIYRNKDYGQFGVASGLQGMRSDWLGALRLSFANGVEMTNRLVFNTDFKITKGEMRLALTREKYGLTSSYVRMLADSTESRTTDVSELTLDGRYQFTPNWEANLSTRYDFEADRAASAGLNLAFRNECLKLDMTLNRRFTSSSSLSATTDFGLSVDLLGFGGSGRRGPAKSCSG